MYDTHCIYCGTKMIWSSDFMFGEKFMPMDEIDEQRAVSEMTCPNCGAEATFIEPRSDD